MPLKSKIEEREAQIKILEEELKILKFQVVSSKSQQKKLKFTLLEGLWKGKTDLSLKEIQSSEIKLKGNF